MKKIVLTIGGSDPSGGAGIQSDIKTFHNHGLYGLSVVTALTSQNTRGVYRSFEIQSNAIRSQLEALFSDFKIRYVKTGMLSSEKVIETLYKVFSKKKIKLIIDPVIFSKNGFRLLSLKGVASLKELLFPLAYLVCPNLAEAEILSGVKIKSIFSLEEAAMRIREQGPRNVIIKGGHINKNIGLYPAWDILYDGEEFHLFAAGFIKTKNTHGTGCVFSAAITSNLVLGKSLTEAVKEAKEYLMNKLINSEKIGAGYSPVEQ